MRSTIGNPEVPSSDQLGANPMERTLKGSNNGDISTKIQPTTIMANGNSATGSLEDISEAERHQGCSIFGFFGYLWGVISSMWNWITSLFSPKSASNTSKMKTVIHGVKTADNTWVKADGRGHQRGYALKKKFEQNNICTVPDIFSDCLSKYGNTKCMGTRKLEQRNKVEEGTKTFEKLTLGDYEWKTYEDISRELIRVAGGLQEMGFKKGGRIAMLAETRADLLTSTVGCFRAGLTVVTLYTNLTDNGLIHGITETEIDTIITSYEVLPRLISILSECPNLKNLIVLEDQLDGVGNVTKVPEHINIVSYSKLLQMGEVSRFDTSDKPDKEDTAIIMYTSGSTGVPKGVEITHSNILASVMAYAIAANLGVGDRYIAFLPLAHIMELATEISLLALGVTIAYSSPHTLTTTSSKIAKGTLGDARVAKPTAMTAVPLILDRIIKGITQKVEKQGKLQGKLFQKALSTKQAYEDSFASRVIDVIIFKKVRAELGGCLKMMVVGGAPLSPQTHSKIRAMFGCTLQVGYGCTESTAGATAMESNDHRTSHAGPPNWGAYIKLESWDEGGYLTTDKPYPRGEIIIGGPGVAKRYFNNENETNAAFFTENGIRWFRTGDIGMFDDTGVLSVVDRRKDLVKLTNGEYVSLGGVESKLKTNCLVDNICVFANSGEDFPVAVIVPNSATFIKFAKKAGVSSGPTLEELCCDEQAAQVMLKELQAHGKKVGLNRWDIPKAVHLSPFAWTPDSGFVTAALKLKRRVLQKEFKNQIEFLYTKTK